MHPGSRVSQVFLCRVPVDFRKQIDGLAALVENELAMSPFADAVYVFINRYRTKMKILYWHRNGFCLWQKRLEKQRFAWPCPPHTGHGFSVRENSYGLTAFSLFASRKSAHHCIISRLSSKCSAL